MYKLYNVYKAVSIGNFFSKFHYRALFTEHRHNIYIYVSAQHLHLCKVTVLRLQLMGQFQEKVGSNETFGVSVRIHKTFLGVQLERSNLRIFINPIPPT